MKRLKFVEYLEFVKQAHYEHNQQDVILMYEGPINQNIVKSFAYLTECRLAAEEESRKTSRVVYHVMLESLQNVTKHGYDFSKMASSDLKTGLSKSGILIVGLDEERWYVTTGNMVRNQGLAKTANLIDRVNSLNEWELKDLHKETLIKSSISESGGAGLGLIDMAKKTNNPLRYNIEPIDDEFSFFILTVMVHKGR